MAAEAQQIRLVNASQTSEQKDVEFLLQSVLPVTYSPALIKLILTGKIQALVSYLGQKPVGCAVWHMGMQPRAKFNNEPFTEAGKIQIMAMAVLPLLRCRGIGSSLMKAVEAYAVRNDTPTVYLHVQAGNSEAIKFYRNHKFTEAEVVANYYRRPAPSDAVRMEKTVLNDST